MTIRCPNCDSGLTAVTDSRGFENTIRRRRKCRMCDHKFSTFEVHESFVHSKHDFMPLLEQFVKGMPNFPPRSCPQCRRQDRIEPTTSGRFRCQRCNIFV